MSRLLSTIAVFGLLGVFAPSALAAPSGAISGKVTDASTHKPIEGLEVCAFSLSEAEEEAEGSYGCAKTASSGEYTIHELAGGNFGVLFGSLVAAIAGPSPAANYILQVYDDKPLSNESPTPVAVSTGNTTKEINAELQEGSEISGIVTNASTGSPVEGVLVCALRGTTPTTIELVTCGRSNASGEYTIEGLPVGEFDVGFAGAGLAVQYYPGKPTPAEATAVSILAAKEVKSGIDAAMQPQAPLTTGLAGSTLPGSTPGSSLPSAGLGGPRASAPKLAVLLSSPRLDVRHGALALVKLACVGRTACHGRLDLTSKRTVRRGDKAVTLTVKIGTVSYSLRRGASTTVVIKVGPYGRGLLGTGHGLLAARLVIKQMAPRPSRTEIESVVLVAHRRAIKH